MFCLISRWKPFSLHVGNGSLLKHVCRIRRHMVRASSTLTPKIVYVCRQVFARLLQFRRPSLWTQQSEEKKGTKTKKRVSSLFTRNHPSLTPSCVKQNCIPKTRSLFFHHHPISPANFPQSLYHQSHLSLLSTHILVTQL